jgi:hypothetical protein
LHDIEIGSAHSRLLGPESGARQHHGASRHPLVGSRYPHSIRSWVARSPLTAGVGPMLRRAEPAAPARVRPAGARPRETNPHMNGCARANSRFATCRARSPSPRTLTAATASFSWWRRPLRLCGPRSAHGGGQPKGEIMGNIYPLLVRPRVASTQRGKIYPSPSSCDASDREARTHVRLPEFVLVKKLSLVL